MALSNPYLYKTPGGNPYQQYPTFLGAPQPGPYQNPYTMEQAQGTAQNNGPASPGGMHWNPGAFSGPTSFTPRAIAIGNQWTGSTNSRGGAFNAFNPVMQNVAANNVPGALDAGSKLKTAHNNSAPFGMTSDQWRTLILVGAAGSIAAGGWGAGAAAGGAGGGAGGVGGGVGATGGISGSMAAGGGGLGGSLGVGGVTTSTAAAGGGGLSAWLGGNMGKTALLNGGINLISAYFNNKAISDANAANQHAAAQRIRQALEQMDPAHIQALVQQYLPEIMALLNPAGQTAIQATRERSALSGRPIDDPFSQTLEAGLRGQLANSAASQAFQNAISTAQGNQSAITGTPIPQQQVVPGYGGAIQDSFNQLLAARYANQLRQQQQPYYPGSTVMYGGF